MFTVNYVCIPYLWTNLRSLNTHYTCAPNVSPFSLVYKLVLVFFLLLPLLFCWSIVNILMSMKSFWLPRARTKSSGSASNDRGDLKLGVLRRWPRSQTVWSLALFCVPGEGDIDRRGNPRACCCRLSYIVWPKIGMFCRGVQRHNFMPMLLLYIKEKLPLCYSR